MLFKKYFKLAALTALLAVLCYWVFDYTQLHLSVHLIAFQTRDLARARALLAGHWIFFGPEMTGGGHLPGPYYYFILAAAEFLRGTSGALQLLIAQNVIAAMLGWLYLRAKCSAETAFIFLVLFMFSVSLDNYMTSFTNAGFMIAYLVAAYICIVEAFQPGTEKHRRYAFAGACLALGMGVQLHASVLAFAAAMAIMQAVSPRFGVTRLPARTVALGLGIFILLLSPYLIWSLAVDLGRPFGQPTFFQGPAGAALPSLIYYFDVPPWGRIREALTHLWHSLPLAFTVLLVVFLGATIAGVREAKGSKLPAYFFPAVTCLLVGIIPALYIFVAPIGLRYSGTLVVPAIFFTALLHEQMASARLRFTVAVLLTMVGTLNFIGLTEISSSRYFTLLVASRRPALAATAIAGTLISLKLLRKPLIGSWSAAIIIVLALLNNPSVWWNTSLESTGLVTPTVSTWLRISDMICDRHGWSFDEVQKRFYFVGIHMELDPLPLMYVDGHDCKKKRQAGAEIPSGYIVVPSLILHEQRLEQWLLEQPLVDEIKTGLKTGTLTLGSPEVIDKLTLAPYYVKSLQFLPPAFHNMGAGYFQTSSHELLVNKGSLTHPVRLETGKYLVSWNECPEHHPYCTTGAMIGLERRDSRLRIEILVIGDSMAQTSPWITPRWTQSWQYPYLDVKCGEQTRHYLLARSIGYDRSYGYPTPNYTFYLSNQAMLAPFKRIVTVDCEPTSLTLGRKSSRIDYIQSFEDLPGQATRVDL